MHPTMCHFSYRILGWLRLIKVIGPFIINLSQVFKDILSMAAVYLFLPVAYTLALMYLKYSKDRIDPSDESAFLGINFYKGAKNEGYLTHFRKARRCVSRIPLLCFYSLG